MITIEEFENICEQLKFHDEATKYLTVKYQMILDSKGASDELNNALEMMFDCKGDYSLVEPHLDQASKATGIIRPEIDMIFRVYSVPSVYDAYRTKSIPDAITYDTLLDTTYELDEYKRVFGGWGTQSLWFYPRLYSVNLFRIGRLEYETFPDADAIGCHISSKGRLNMDEVMESLKMAYKFFGYEGTGKVMKIVCDSWILFPAMGNMYPEGSNLKKFFDLFTITDSKETDEDLWYIFWKPIDTPVDELPTDTSLQRKCADYLKSGKMLGTGEGYFYFDGIKTGKFLLNKDGKETII